MSEPRPAPVTVEEYQRISDPRDARLTLTRGVLGKRPWAGLRHGFLQGSLWFRLGSRLDRSVWAVLGVGVVTHRDPDTVRLAEVAVYNRETLGPHLCPVTDYPTVGPSLAVEIVDPRDTPSGTLAIVNDLLDAGTGQVVVLNPETRTAAIHRPGERAVVLRDEDRLPLPPPFADWRPTVAELLTEEQT